MRFRGAAAGVEGRVDQKFDLELRGATGGGVRDSVGSITALYPKPPSCMMSGWLLMGRIHVRDPATLLRCLRASGR